VSAKLWGKIRKNRSGLDSNLKVLPNAGAVDGFPIVIILNGEFHGLYTFNIPKDGWMFGLVEDTTKTQAIVGANDHTTATQFKEECLVDESDFELEFVSDEDNADWVATSLNRLINACIDSWGGDLNGIVGRYVDLESAIDYIIFTALIDGRDCTDKNYILTTFDGTKWFFSAYDLDSTYGLRWNASMLHRPDETIGDAVTFDKLRNVHRLFELIIRFKTDELKARYTALRNSVLSEYAIAEMFENFAWAIPSPVLVEDVKLYPTILGSSVNTVNQILRWLHHRLEIVDKWVDALPAQEEPVNPQGYTNWVPRSTDADGNIYNGVGYKDGWRVKYDTGEETDDNKYFTVSGFIPVTPGDVVRIYGVDWYTGTNDAQAIVGYDENFAYVGAVYGLMKIAGSNIAADDGMVVLNESDFQLTTRPWRAELAYVRVCATRFTAPQEGANMIVTVNEEIT
jgi:hypothetical protein